MSSVDLQQAYLVVDVLLEKELFYLSLLMHRIVHIQNYLKMHNHISQSHWETMMRSLDGLQSTQHKQLEMNTDLSGCHHLWTTSANSERKEKEVQSSEVLHHFILHHQNETILYSIC